MTKNSQIHFFSKRPAVASGAAAVLACLIVFAAAGCAEKIELVKGAMPTYPYRTAAPHGSKWIKADSLWEHRLDFDTARLMLKTYRDAADRQDGVPELLSKLSHACYYVASYVETSVEKKDRLFREGQQAAIRALDLNPAFHQVYKESGDESEAIRDVGADYVEALFWYAANLGRELSQENVIIRQGNKYKLEAFNDKILQLDESFYYGAPHRIAGIIPLRLPGGNMNVSRQHFEKAVAIAPLYFGNRVLFAEIYAVAAHDKKTFLDQLGFVVATPADTLRAVTPENKFEQEHAKALLAKADILFR